MKIIITGGAGFIGSAVIRHLIQNTSWEVVNLDKLTYAGSLDSVSEVSTSKRYSFERVDICDHEGVRRVFREHQPAAIMHLAAESHVDRSINAPSDFIKTNIVGTYTLLEVAAEYYSALPESQQKTFRFHHVSTDEVYGDLGVTGSFTEETPYCPSSPYAASKASSDHLVRSWNRTFGLPIIISTSSNNYGSYQFPEKLIPLMLLNAMAGKPLTIYGNGKQVRDWLYVEDHAQALCQVVSNGKVGETYNIGSNNEKQNIEVVQTICEILDEKVPDKLKGINTFRELIIHVQDRSGHDQRYSIDASKIKRDLYWEPVETFESGIAKTIDWYLANIKWCRQVAQVL